MISVKVLLAEGVPILDRGTLGGVVQRIVAEALSCEDELLEPDDIRVVFDRASTDSGCPPPFEVFMGIEASDYPDRFLAQKDLEAQVRDAVQRRLPKCKVGVRLDLKPAPVTN